MSKQSALRPYFIRLLIVLAGSTIFTLLFNEGAYFIQKEKYDRAPQTIQLVIPNGTAQRIEAGEQVPTIPEEMSFVLGDVLQVKNEDVVSHQLGPIWVPPGATGSLTMEKAAKLAYSCSFSATRYLGLDIHEATTMSTRITALLIAAPTLGVLVFLYSLLAIPINSKEPTGQATS